MDLSAEEFKKKGTYTYGFMVAIVITIVSVTIQFVTVSDNIEELNDGLEDYYEFKESTPKAIKEEKQEILAKMNLQMRLGIDEMGELEGRMDRKTGRNVNKIKELEAHIDELQHEIAVLTTRIDYCK